MGTESVSPPGLCSAPWGCQSSQSPSGDVSPWDVCTARPESLRPAALPASLLSRLCPAPGLSGCVGLRFVDEPQ